MQIVEDIRAILRHSSSTKCKFNWVQRNGNRAAHNLTSWGFSHSVSCYFLLWSKSLNHVSKNNPLLKNKSSKFIQKQTHAKTTWKKKRKKRDSLVLN